MQDLYSEWEKWETAYKGDQAKETNRPNTRINITNANIEGQISAMIDQNLSITTIPQSPNDEAYSK
jgi:hypothetical protein